MYPFFPKLSSHPGYHITHKAPLNFLTLVDSLNGGPVPALASSWAPPESSNCLLEWTWFSVLALVMTPCMSEALFLMLVWLVQSLLAPPGLLCLRYWPGYWWGDGSLHCKESAGFAALQRTCAQTAAWPTYLFTSLQTRAWRMERAWTSRWQHRTWAKGALFPFVCVESIRTEIFLSGHILYQQSWFPGNWFNF